MLLLRAFRILFCHSIWTYLAFEAQAAAVPSPILGDEARSSFQPLSKANLIAREDINDTNIDALSALDTRFTVTYEDDPSIPIDLISTYILTIESIGSMSEKDWVGDMAACRWRSKGFEKLEIYSYGIADDSSIVRRYAIWGMQKVIWRMTEESNFVSTEVTLYWQRRIVGHLVYVPVRDTSDMNGVVFASEDMSENEIDITAPANSSVNSPKVYTGNATALSDLQSSGMSNNTGDSPEAVTDITANDFRTHIVVEETTRGLPFRTLALVLVELITEVAPRLSTKIVTPIAVSPPPTKLAGFDVTFRTGYAQSPRRRQPPFYTWQAMSRACKYLPRRLIGQPIYFQATILVDLIAVGDASITPGRVSAVEVGADAAIQPA